MKKSLALALSAAILCGSMAGCADSSDSSSSAPVTTAAPTTTETTTAEPTTAEPTTEPLVAKTPPTGVVHVIDDDNCNVMDFKPGDTVSGKVNRGYGAFAYIADFYGDIPMGVSISDEQGNEVESHELNFCPIRIGNCFVVYGNIYPLKIEVNENGWETYNKKEAEGLSEEELEQYRPKPFDVEGRIEPMPEDVEGWFKEWFLNHFSDATEENYTEYCQNAVCIIDKNYDS